MKISLFKDKRLKTAIMKNDLKIVSKLLKEDTYADITIDGKTALIYALEKGYFAIALKLIEAHANVLKTDDDGYSPLHYAFINEKTPLRIIKSLVLHGAKVNAISSIGRTPLHMACINGNLIAMRYLISMGGDVYRTDMFGNSLMHMACMNNYTDIAKFLISNELNPYQENKQGVKAIDLLEDSKKQKLYFSIRFRYRKKTQDDLMIEKRTLKIPMRKESLNTPGVDLIFDDSKKKLSNILFIACKKGNVEYARHLIDMGADVTATDMLGNNLLMNMACKNDDIKMIRLLMNNGVSVFKNNYLGHSPADLLSNKVRQKLLLEDSDSIDIYDNNAFQSGSHIKNSTSLDIIVMPHRKAKIATRSISLVDFRSKDKHSKFFQP